MTVVRGTSAEDFCSGCGYYWFTHDRVHRDDCTLVRAGVTCRDCGVDLSPANTTGICLECRFFPPARTDGGDP